MLKYLSSVRMSYKLIALGGALFILFALMGVIVLRQILSAAGPAPILKISYCGAVPEELCVLSFGRDLEENMVINLFVPESNFPDFYLKIQRAAVEGTYECVKDREVPTSVYCVGEMIGLQEKMEISLLSKADDHLMASGKLTLLAVLLSPVGGSVLTPEVIIPDAQIGGFGVTETTLPAEITETVTPNPVFDIATPTSTPVSYPGPSYP